MMCTRRVVWGIGAVLAVLGCGGGGSDAPEPTATPAASAPPKTERSVTCRFTGQKEKLSCEDIADCPDEGAEVVCRGGLVDFFASSDSTEINNWIRDGVWSRKKGSWTLLDTEARGFEGELTWDGGPHKGLTLASHRAGVLLVGDAASNHALRGPIVAYARFVEYQEGMVFDDVALEAGALYTGAEAELQRAAWRLHRALKGAGDIKDLRVGGTREELIGDLWTATEGLDPNDRKALLLFNDTTASEVTAKYAAAKAKRIELTRPTFEADAWARAAAVALPWDDAFGSSLSDHGWALPGAGGCKGTPATSDADEIKAEEARRAEYVGEITRYARVVPLEVRAKTDGTATDVQVELFGDKSLVVSGRATMKSTPSCGPECCNVFTGECQVRLFGCERGEVVRTTCGPPDYDWSIAGVAGKLTFPAPVTFTKDSAVPNVEAEAIVVVSKAFHVCKSDVYLSRLWSGDVVGYRVKDSASGATLLQVIKRDVSIDEALSGPERFRFKAAKK